MVPRNRPGSAPVGDDMSSVQLQSHGGLEKVPVPSYWSQTPPRVSSDFPSPPDKFETHLQPPLLPRVISLNILFLPTLHLRLYTLVLYSSVLLSSVVFCLIVTCDGERPRFQRLKRDLIFFCFTSRLHGSWFRRHRPRHNSDDASSTGSSSSTLTNNSDDLSLAKEDSPQSESKKKFKMPFRQRMARHFGDSVGARSLVAWGEPGTDLRFCSSALRSRISATTMCS